MPREARHEEGEDEDEYAEACDSGNDHGAELPGLPALPSAAESREPVTQRDKQRLRGHEDAVGLRRRLGSVSTASPARSQMQRARGDVPAVHAALVVRVVAAGGAPREVQRRGAEAADVADVGQQRGDLAPPARGGPRRRSRTPWRSAPWRARCAPRPGRARRRASPAAALGRPQLVRAAGRRRRPRAAVGVLDRDRDRPLRDPEQEVDRPVERVDDPAQPARPASSPPSSPRNRRRAARPQPRADQRLGGLVGLRDEVGRRALGLDLERGPPNASSSWAPASRATSSASSRRLMAPPAGGGRPSRARARAARPARAACPRRRAARRAAR